MLAMLTACRRFLLLGLLACTSGCAMCGTCEDETYGAYGGRWERLDPYFGRVGSAFTPEVGTQVVPDEIVAPLDKTESAEEVKPGAPKPNELQTPNVMPGDDAPPAPPDTLPEPENKSADASVLRYPARAAR